MPEEHATLHGNLFTTINLIVAKNCGLPQWLSGKKYACNAEAAGSILRSGRSPAEGNGNPLQYSFLGKPMDRGAWQATVHGVTKVRHD